MGCTGTDYLCCRYPEYHHISYPFFLATGIRFLSYPSSAHFTAYLFDIYRSPYTLNQDIQFLSNYLHRTRWLAVRDSSSSLWFTIYRPWPSLYFSYWRQWLPWWQYIATSTDKSYQQASVPYRALEASHSLAEYTTSRRMPRG